MRLVSYKLKHQSSALRMGFVENDRIIDLQTAYNRSQPTKTECIPSDPNVFYSKGLPLIERVKDTYEAMQRVDLDGISYHRNEVYISTPIPNPSKIICVGKNYKEHALEMESKVPDYPVLFAKFDNALIGPDDEIVKSKQTEKFDYEVELTVVIGKDATNVSRQNAFDYIAGYTIGNDGSARDLQKRTPQWLQGKTLDDSTPVGPWVITTDELVNPNKLAIQSFVNGELRQSSNTSKLIFDIPYLIEFISGLMTLKPGDIILTGTPDGVGFAMDPPQFLQEGDTIRVEIEHIGEMENKVVAKD